MPSKKDLLRAKKDNNNVAEMGDVAAVIRNLRSRLSTIESTYGIAATGRLSGTENFVDTDTLDIGFSGSTKTYTFQDTLTDVDGNVHIGADLAESLDNLVAAINLDAGAGTDYATSMTENPDVSAARGVNAADLDMIVTAKVVGSGGNDITTTETFTNDPAWDNATLTGGQ